MTYIHTNLKKHFQGRLKEILYCLIVISFALNQTYYTYAYAQQEAELNIILVQYSECSDCVRKYQDYVKPFYEKYRYNYSFEIIDAATSQDYFFDKMAQLGIDVGSYGNFPWVIFILNSTLIVIDASSLGKIESTFIDLIGGEPVITTELDPVPTNTESINIEILPLTGILFILTLTAFLGGIFITNKVLEKKYSSNLYLHRIGKNRLLTILAASFVSTLTLFYQLIDHYSGGCGCASENLAKTLLFRQYDHIMFGPLEIPISLIGIGLTLSVSIQTLLIGTLPAPLHFFTFKDKKITLTEQHLRYWHYLLCVEMILAFLSLFALIYVELVLVNFICILCTVSQIIIVINTVLILSWKPFVSKGH
ncbi:MAG: hypothetical protein ACTSPV_10460 [Candidatus Hodarchaeales archaeon]